MEEQLISFETAKLAKEKRFILGIGWFGHDQKFYYEGQLTDNYRGDNPVACTQSLLQKWLRETHNIHLYIEPFWKSEEIENKSAKPQYCPWIIDNYEEEDPPTYYTTYEQALEAGLFEALNLIK